MVGDANRECVLTTSGGSPEDRLMPDQSLSFQQALAIKIFCFGSSVRLFVLWHADANCAAGCVTLSRRN